MKVKKPMKPKKIIIRSVLALALLFCTYMLLWRVSLMDGTIVNYLGDYSDYYFTVRFKPNTLPSPFGSGRQVIYFKPGQKSKMMKEIKKDVAEVLDTLVDEHGDVCNRYEIDEVFFFVTIYVSPDFIDNYEYSDIKRNTESQLKSLMILYHGVRGRRLTSDTMVRFITPDGNTHFW